MQARTKNVLPNILVAKQNQEQRIKNLNNGKLRFKIVSFFLVSNTHKLQHQKYFTPPCSSPFIPKQTIILLTSNSFHDL